MKLTELHETSLFKHALKKLRGAGKRVSTDATFQYGGGPTSLLGEVREVRDMEFIVQAHGRAYPIAFRASDDDLLTIVKDKHSDFYWVRNASEIHEEVDNRPLVWRLAAQQLAKGKKVCFHGHLPNSSSYLVGRVEKIGGAGATLYDLGGRDKVVAIFTADDDSNLTMRPTRDPSVGDYMIVDVE